MIIFKTNLWVLYVDFGKNIVGLGVDMQSVTKATCKCLTQRIQHLLNTSLHPQRQISKFEKDWKTVKVKAFQKFRFDTLLYFVEDQNDRWHARFWPLPRQPVICLQLCCKFMHSYTKEAGKPYFPLAFLHIENGERCDSNHAGSVWDERFWKVSGRNTIHFFCAKKISK